MLVKNQTMSLLFSISSMILLGCSAKPSASQLKTTTASHSYALQIASEAEFLDLQRSGDGYSFIKYSNFYKEPGSPVYFQNTQTFEFHLDFFHKAIPRLQSLTNDQYESMMFDPAAREVNAGAVYYSPGMQVPGVEGVGILGFNIYFKSGVNPEYVAVAAARLKETVPFAQGRIVYLFETNADFFKYRNALLQKGVPSFPLSRFLNQGISTRVYNAAKSYGYLKALSAEEAQAGDYSSKDIVLMEETPLDLNPVSGVITAKPQPPHSHIIFRAVNMKIPCAFLPGANEQLKSAIGQLVELETTVDNTVIVRTAAELGEANLKQAAEQYFKSRVPKIPEPPLDLSRKEIIELPSASLNKSYIGSYGAKATNFGMLDQSLRTAGIDRSYFDGAMLLPMSLYEEHISQKLSDKVCRKALEKCAKIYAKSCDAAALSCQQLTAGSASVRQLSQKLFDKPSTAVLLADTKLRRGTLEFMRQVIARTPMVESTKASLKAKLEQRFQPTSKRIRMRSSTNAEDLVGLNGAGLYISKSACLADSAAPAAGRSACMSDIEEARIHKLISRLQAMANPSLANQIADLQDKLLDKDEMDDAIRKVYASVWNEKAFLTRDYYGIDHQKIHMGILVHPAFADETANGVIVVNLSDIGMRASVVVQNEDVSVTNPALPGALPEEWVLDLNAEGVIATSSKIRSSSIIQGNVLNNEQLKNLMQQLAIVQRSMSQIHGAGANRLDIEFIMSANGQVLIKQARPL